MLLVCNGVFRVGHLPQGTGDGCATTVNIETVANFNIILSGAAFNGSIVLNL